jgi:formylglycine-generating enzyme required for sulfatase activity
MEKFSSTGTMQRSGSFAFAVTLGMSTTFNLLFCLLVISFAPVHAQPETGDVNDDGAINVADVTALGEAVDQGSLPPVEVGDVNEDGAVDEADVAALARFIVDAGSGPSEPEEIVIALPGDIELVMVRIAAGTFLMGSPLDERGRAGVEGPQTEVTISQDFYMGKYEVTQAQWLSLMETWPNQFAPSELRGLGPNHPAYWLSWNDAQAFITALNEHIEESDQGPRIVRLPTEAQWEYAARAGTTTRFSFGDSLTVADACEDDGVRSQYMWYCGNANMQSHPVGEKLPNPFGLFDMHGNVREWCQDSYSPYPGGSVTDPQGSPTSSISAGRGGAWSTQAFGCRSANRSGGGLRNGFEVSLGFRLAADP